MLMLFDAGTKGRGWSDIGYHFVILRNGTIENGRFVGLVGANFQQNTHLS